MVDNERLTMETNALDGYTLKCLCTFGRDGEPTDEWGCNEHCADCNEDCKKCGIQEAFDKLAAYENTDLSPEEVMKLKKKAADAEPVKHGYNNNRNYHGVDEFRCSICGIHLEDWTMYEFDEDLDEENCREYEFQYCPNCGARMDGDAFEKGM